MTTRYDIALGKKPKPPTLGEEMAFLRDAYERAATNNQDAPMAFLKNLGQLYKDDQISKAAYDKMLTECSAAIRKARERPQVRGGRNQAAQQEILNAISGRMGQRSPSISRSSGCGPSNNTSGRC